MKNERTVKFLWPYSVCEISFFDGNYFKSHSRDLVQVMKKYSAFCDINGVLVSFKNVPDESTFEPGSYGRPFLWLHYCKLSTWMKILESRKALFPVTEWTEFVCGGGFEMAQMLVSHKDRKRFKNIPMPPFGMLQKEDGTVFSFFKEGSYHPNPEKGMDFYYLPIEHGDFEEPLSVQLEKEVKRVLLPILNKDPDE